MSDPLPQAMMLTAIVITFGVTAFVLALIYRSWALARNEAVADDEEDRRVAGRHDTEPTSSTPTSWPRRTGRPGTPTASPAAGRTDGTSADDVDLPLDEVRP